MRGTARRGVVAVAVCVALEPVSSSIIQSSHVQRERGCVKG